MALERVPADIRKDGGVSRMSDPKVTIVKILILLYHSLMYSPVSLLSGIYSLPAVHSLLVTFM